MIVKCLIQLMTLYFAQGHGILTHHHLHQGDENSALGYKVTVTLRQCHPTIRNGQQFQLLKILNYLGIYLLLVYPGFWLNCPMIQKHQKLFSVMQFLISCFEAKKFGMQ